MVIFVLIGSRLGSSPSSGRVSLKPEPVSGFILNIRTRPYCFTSQVKPTSLGSGGIEPDTHGLGTFLPYLIENPIDEVYCLKTVTWSMSQLYHCFVMFTSRCSSTNCNVELEIWMLVQQTIVPEYFLCL